MSDGPLEDRSNSRGCLSGVLALLFIGSLCAIAATVVWQWQVGLGPQSLAIIGGPAILCLITGGALVVVQRGADRSEFGSNIMEGGTTTSRPLSKLDSPVIPRVLPAVPHQAATATASPQTIKAELAPPPTARTSPTGVVVMKRALIVGGFFALLPALFFGFFIFGVVGAKPPEAIFFGVFILFAMLMFASFGIVATLMVHAFGKRMSGKFTQQIFEPFARHVNGRVESPPPGLFGLQVLPPSVWFAHNGLPAVLRIEVEGAGKHRVVYTALEFTLSDISPSDLRVSPQGILHQVGKWLGMQDLEVGDAAFDERFVVRASMPAAALPFLNPEVRRALLEMSEWRRQTPPTMLGSSGFVDLSLRGRSFKLRTLGYLGHAQQMIQFYQQCGRVIDAFLPGSVS